MNSDPTSGDFEQSLVVPSDIERYDPPETIDAADDLDYKSEFFADIVYSFADIAKAIQESGETRFTVSGCRSRLLQINPEIAAYFTTNEATREAILDISFEVFATMFSITKLTIAPYDAPEIVYEFDFPDTFISVGGEKQATPVQVFGNSIISDALQMIIPANRQVSSQDIAKSLYELGLYTSKISTWTDANITYRITEVSTPQFSSTELEITTIYPDDETLLVEHRVVISDKISSNDSESGCSLEIKETVGLPVQTEYGTSIQGVATTRNTATENDKMIIRDAIEILHEKNGPIEL